MKFLTIYSWCVSWILFLITVACSNSPRSNNTANNNNDTAIVSTGAVYKDSVSLPPPYHTKSVKNFSKVIGWSNGKSPVAPAGFLVTKYADGLKHPRWIYVTAGGDVLVAEASTEVKGVKKIAAEITGIA